MDIVYCLENKNKKSGKRFYVGAKSECKVLLVDGVNTMINVRNGKPYYGSSSSYDMKSDMVAGDVFEVKVLQKVVGGSNLFEVESDWISKLSAVESDEYYNISNSLVKNIDQDVIVNTFGESLKELSSRNSSCSKRDNKAAKLGFSNFGLLCVHIHKESISNSWANVSKDLGMHRHFAKTTVSKFNMDKCVKELASGDLYRDKVRVMVAKNASVYKAAEVIGIEVPTARVLLGDYYSNVDRSYSVSMLSGLTKNEMEVKITKMILEGNGFRDVSDELGITNESVKRYFFRKIRSILKSSDIH